MQEDCNKQHKGKINIDKLKKKRITKILSVKRLPWRETRTRTKYKVIW